MKPLQLVLGALALLWVAWRWRRLSGEGRVLMTALGIGLLVYGTGAIHLPKLEESLLKVGDALGRWTYLLVGVLAFLETGAFVGLIAPGETALILGGVVAGQGKISIVVLIAIVWAAAVAGDVTSFWLGRRLGRDFMLRHGPRVKITPARLEQVEGFFARHGGKTILIGRFVGLVRAVAPFIAGASRLPFRRFIPYDLIGAGLWGAAFTLLGYAFWQSLSQVIAIAKRGAFALGAVIALVVGVVAAVRHLRVPENRARVEAWLHAQAQRPALRPLVRVLGPVHRRVGVPVWNRVVVPLRFLWNRITPGELGLELTTLLALALVGAFTYAFFASLLGNPSLLDVDRHALRVADDLRAGWLNSTAKLVTQLGSQAVLWPVLGLGALWLAATGRRVDALTLLVAFGLTILFVHIGKAAHDRPRPFGPLVSSSGSSFPSGHAAYAVAWVALAVVAVRDGPGWLQRVTLVAAAIVVAVAVALTRLYLRVHYLSDVLAGLGLGLLVFAACGMVALVVSFLRDNGRAA